MREFHTYRFPSMLTQVLLDGMDVTDKALVEVAIGAENYGYVVAKREIPSGYQKTMIDGQILTHSYWGHILFAANYPTRVYPSGTIIDGPMLFGHRLEVVNTSQTVVKVAGTSLNPGDTFMKLVAPKEVIYASTSGDMVELNINIQVVDL